MKVIENTRPKKVRVGDEILAYGTVTAIDSRPNYGHDGHVISGPFFATDVGYSMLHFPADYDVPVISKRFWIHE